LPVFSFFTSACRKIRFRHPCLFGQRPQFYFTGTAAGSGPATSRAAQGVGLVLFFVMLILGGAGPPPEAMTHLMR